MDAYLSTKRGKVNSITIYSYDFTPYFLKLELSKRENYLYWLINRSGFLFYNIDESGFQAFEPLKKSCDSQYQINSSKTISSPYKNTQQISQYISFLLKQGLKNHYTQFLNENIFVVETHSFNPFNLLKSIEFNVEVFSTGDFFIHVVPISKIVSDINPINREYVERLKIKNQNNSHTDSMVFNIVNTEKYYRKFLDLLSSDLFTQLDGYHQDNQKFTATFDYHFLANFSPTIFGEISSNTNKDLKRLANFLNPVLSNFKLPESFNLVQENFYKVELKGLMLEKNLLVGSDAEQITLHSKNNTKFGLRIEYTCLMRNKTELIVNFLNNPVVVDKINKLSLPTTIQASVFENNSKKVYLSDIYNNENTYKRVLDQSSSYYTGIYKPINGQNILPIIFGDLSIDIFYELIQKFNKGGLNNHILAPICYKQNDEVRLKDIENAFIVKLHKPLIVIFTKYVLPNESIESVKKFPFLIYQGEIKENMNDRAKLSNFSCKCLEKLGGLISVVDVLFLSKGGYFVGIDLGHTTVGKERFSNIAAAIFDHHGQLIGSKTIKNIPRKENLQEEVCFDLFKDLSKILNRNKLQKPIHIVIHRDGKLHQNDIQILVNSIQKNWGEINVDIVEIIKSGFPIMMVKKETNLVENPKSGVSFQCADKKYALLATNTQANEHNGAINPIVIKHKYGNLDFDVIIEQVYWFTKVYTNNLYNSTRLPATTLKANNIVGTSRKRHKPTYLG